MLAPGDPQPSTRRAIRAWTPGSSPQRVGGSLVRSSAEARSRGAGSSVRPRRWDRRLPPECFGRRPRATRPTLIRAPHTSPLECISMRAGSSGVWTVGPADVCSCIACGSRECTGWMPAVPDSRSSTATQAKEEARTHTRTPQLPRSIRIW